MKKLVCLIAIAALFVQLTFAQIPSGFNYQTVVRSLSGNILANTEIKMRISILRETTEGAPVSVETFTTRTNAIGLVNLIVGSLDVSFKQIDWSEGPYFLKVELDEKGGTNFSFIGTSQLLSVPYAFHARMADSANETDPLFSAWDKSTGISIKESQISDLKHFKNSDELDPIFSASPAFKITNTDIVNWNMPELDPIFNASIAKGITASDISRWNAKSGFDGKYTSLTNIPSFHPIAFSGDYKDLTNVPLHIVSLSQAPQKGDILYFNGTQWTRLPVGKEGQFLSIDLTGIPVWK